MFLPLKQTVSCVETVLPVECFGEARIGGFAFHAVPAEYGAGCFLVGREERHFLAEKAIILCPPEMRQQLRFYVPRAFVGKPVEDMFYAPGDADFLCCAVIVAGGFALGIAVRAEHPHGDRLVGQVEQTAVAQARFGAVAAAVLAKHVVCGRNKRHTDSVPRKPAERNRE